MYTLYCWSMTDAYPAIQQGFVQGLVALTTQLAAEGDAGEDMKALLVGRVYSETFDTVVLQKTNIQLPAFCKQLGTSLDKEVVKFNEIKILYNTLRSAVHETVQNYDAATRVASTTNVAIVGPLIGRLEVHETSLTSAIAHMRARRQMRHHGDCLKLLKWMEHMHFDASSPNMRGNIRQWRSVVDSLGPDVPVKYNPASGLPMKFSANALG